jgi:Toastrack DUF4097
MAKITQVPTFLYIAGILTLASGCRFQINDGYSFDFRGVTSEKSASETIDASVKSIEIKNKFGDVHIEQSSGEGNWTWDGKCWATDKIDADDFVSQLEMRVEQEGDRQTWTITLPARSRKLRGVKSNLTVQIPSPMSVIITNEHGKVTAHGLSGTTMVDNEHGPIEATKMSGQSTLKIQHGQIVASDLLGATNIDCEHGNITIDGSSEILLIQCEHGNVDIKESYSDVTTVTEHGNTTIESSGPNVNCKAKHGNLTITMESTEFGSIVADTEHSDVEILLPFSARPRVDMTVDHGQAKSDIQSNQDQNAPQVRVKTEHGDIMIRSQQPPAEPVAWRQQSSLKLSVVNFKDLLACIKVTRFQPGFEPANTLGRGAVSKPLGNDEAL